MTVLYLLRHGPTEAGRRGAPLGRMDLPVTESGEARWPQVRAELLGLGLERVLTSDLRRARDHAQALGLPCRVDPALAEQAFGAWDGVPWAEVQDSAAFFTDPIQGVPPGGESFAQCAERVLAALPGLLEPVPTLVLAHGGPCRILLAHFLGLPLARALDLAWQPFGLTRLERYGPERATLVFHNRVLP